MLAASGHDIELDPAEGWDLPYPPHITIHDDDTALPPSVPEPVDESLEQSDAPEGSAALSESDLLETIGPAP